MPANNFESIQFYLSGDKYLSCSETLFIEILFFINCRFAELKGSKWSLFFPDKYLLLEAVKHSENIIIRDRSILKKINSLERLDKDFIFPHITYSRIYKLIKSRYGHLLPTNNKRKTQPVTHAPRYNSVSSQLPAEFNRLILHHKSIKTQRFYLSNK